MPEPLSIGLFGGLGYVIFSTYARAGSAVSRESQEVTRAACAIVESVEQSHALFGQKAAAISQLRALANECVANEADPGPIARETLQNAEDFVRALPDGVPMPEFAADPDGAISLDWIQTRTRVFSISIAPSNRLAYAWLDGADRGHAVALFDGFSIPRLVLSAIESILKPRNASIRVT